MDIGNIILSLISFVIILVVVGIAFLILTKILGKMGSTAGKKNGELCNQPRDCKAGLACYGSSLDNQRITKCMPLVSLIDMIQKEYKSTI